jgi:hypothetical protein
LVSKAHDHSFSFQRSIRLWLAVKRANESKQASSTRDEGRRKGQLRWPHERTLFDVDLAIRKEVGEAELGRRSQLLRHVLRHARVEEHPLFSQISTKPVTELIDPL